MKFATDPATWIDVFVVWVAAISFIVGVALWGGYMLFLLFWGGRSKE